MNKLNTSARLKEVMAKNNLKQVDILELCKPYCKKYNVKLNKNDLSQYVSGKVKPGQRKLSILSLALNVSEAWLMGYDVPMIEEKEEIDWSQFKELEEKIPVYESVDKFLGHDFYKLISLYDILNQEGKQKVLDYIVDICESNKYVKEDTDDQMKYQLMNMKIE